MVMLATGKRMLGQQIAAVLAGDADDRGGFRTTHTLSLR